MMVDNNMIVSGGVSAAGAVSYQTVTGASAVLSTNTVDLQNARDIGEGQQVFARMSVGTAFAGLTALTAEIIVADDAALTTNVTVIGSTGAIPVASLTAGARFAVAALPRISQTGRRYLGMRYTPSGTGTAGTVFADYGIEVADASAGAKATASGFAVL